MYFNIPEELVEKYEKFFPNLLLGPAAEYNEFEDSFKDEDSIVLALNRHLQLFPIINNWRVEVFFQWDVCRQSLICASAIVKEFCVNFNENDSTDERNYYELLVEYYLDNISYRVFSILDKIGHPLNLVFNLNLGAKQVSYFNIINKIENDWPDINKLFLEFKNNDTVIAEYKEYRNSITHRNHLLQPKYELEKKKVGLDEDNESRFYDKLFVTMPEKSNPKINIIQLYETVEITYNRLTILLEKIFLALLKEINERYTNEQDVHEYLRELAKNKK